MHWLVTLCTIIVILFAAGPYVVAWRLREEAEAGCVSFEMLSAATGIYDRDELAKRFGVPNSEDCYLVSSEFAARPTGPTAPPVLFQAGWFRWLNSDVVSIACLLACLAAVVLFPSDRRTAVVLAVAPAAVQGAKWLVACAAIGPAKLKEIWHSCD